MGKLKHRNVIDSDRLIKMFRDVHFYSDSLYVKNILYGRL